MAYLDRADCILRLKDRLNRPSTDSAFTVSATDDVWLRFMTEANDELTKLIAAFVPDAMIGVPTALVTADSGKTYTFGTDVDSANVFPLGFVNIYDTRNDIPDYPLIPGVDYTLEGTRIRIPYNVTRTFSDSGPWAQFINAANAITSSTQPTIPVLFRLAMVERTAAKGARRLGLDGSEFEAEFEKRWMEGLMAVRTQANGKYGANVSRRNWSYWRR